MWNVIALDQPARLQIHSIGGVRREAEIGSRVQDAIGREVPHAGHAHAKHGLAIIFRAKRAFLEECLGAAVTDDLSDAEVAEGGLALFTKGGDLNEGSNRSTIGRNARISRCRLTARPLRDC